MKRLHQVLLIGTFLPLCWFGMMAVHELGHVLGAVATGGTVRQVVLHPSTISRTDVWPNPAPLAVVWAGPAAGVLLPLSAFLAVKVGRSSCCYLFQFFAGFCLIANGAYLGGGSFGGSRNASDPGVMLASASPIWSLWVFAAVTIPLGLYLWNGLGPRFGLGASKGKVDSRAAYACCLILCLVLAVESALSSR